MLYLTNLPVVEPAANVEREIGRISCGRIIAVVSQLPAFKPVIAFVSICKSLFLSNSLRNNSPALYSEMLQPLRSLIQSYQYVSVARYCIYRWHWNMEDLESTYIICSANMRIGSWGCNNSGSLCCHIERAFWSSIQSLRWICEIFRTRL